ncbi:hypothetical protein AQUCO_00300109v1 [Aquilegia coerulea]|uniref:Uncharacterized protein n=1 Tax=Aquilegia coerulea TaxID=218851 RepID=A0A2G5EXK3_AQUCA|nr:hypothetical protein AQUCO_00300109v1 [Aquilegia coerulea]
MAGDKQKLKLRKTRNPKLFINTTDPHLHYHIFNLHRHSHHQSTTTTTTNPNFSHTVTKVRVLILYLMAIDSLSHSSSTHHGTSSLPPPPPPQFYMDEKWKLSKKECSRSRSSSTTSATPFMRNSSKRRCAFTRKCATLVKEQRARFYIMRRCVTMLICWRDYGDS